MEKETVNKGEFRSGCGKSTSDDYFYRATGQRLHKEDSPELKTHSAPCCAVHYKIDVLRPIPLCARRSIATATGRRAGQGL